MKIFQDVFNQEEFLSDSYKIEELYNGVVYCVKSRLIVKNDGDVNVYDGNAFGGKNEQDEQGGAGGNGGAPVAKVIDLVDAFGYEETSFPKADFQAYFKQYMKKVLEYLGKNKPDRVDPFKAGAKQYYQWVIKNYDDISFYAGKSYDFEGLIVAAHYKNEEDESPHFYYIADGLKFYKV